MCVLIKKQRRMHMEFDLDILEQFFVEVICNAALCSRRKKHFIFDSINTITAPSFR